MRARVGRLTNEASPQVLAPWMLPENLSINCFEGGPGDPVLMREFSAHQILQFPNLFFQSWYSAGLRAWDVSNPWLPSEVGVFVPKPEYPNVVEPFRNSPDVWTWSYPVLYSGLIHVMDENSGLFILKYSPPGGHPRGQRRALSVRSQKRPSTLDDGDGGLRPGVAVPVNVTADLACSGIAGTRGERKPIGDGTDGQIRKGGENCIGRPTTG